jgi:hypothetical protein
MTFSINIRTNVKAFEKKVSAAAFKQIPFATAQALNAIAKQVIAAEQKNEHTVLDRPRPFTTGALTVRRATKVTMQATVFMKDITAAYLEPYEFGGRNKLNSKALLKPVEAVKDLDQFGNLPRNFLRKLKGRRDVFVGSVRTKAGMVQGVWQRDTSVDVELPLFSRTGKLRTPKARMNTSGRLVLLVKFEDAHQVKQHLDWFGVASRTIARTFNREMGKALAKAIASAK